MLFIASHKAIRTIATTLLTTVTTPQEIPSGEDHQSIFEVIVLTLFKQFWLFTLFCTRIHLCLFVAKTLTLRLLFRSCPACETHSQNIPDRKDCRHIQRTAVVFGHHPTATNSSRRDQLLRVL